MFQNIEISAFETQMLRCSVWVIKWNSSLHSGITWFAVLFVKPVVTVLCQWRFTLTHTSTFSQFVVPTDPRHLCCIVTACYILPCFTTQGGCFLFYSGTHENQVVDTSQSNHAEESKKGRVNGSQLEGKMMVMRVKAFICQSSFNQKQMDGWVKSLF